MLKSPKLPWWASSITFVILRGAFALIGSPEPTRDAYHDSAVGAGAMFLFWCDELDAKLAQSQHDCRGTDGDVQRCGGTAADVGAGGAAHVDLRSFALASMSVVCSSFSVGAALDDPAPTSGAEIHLRALGEPARIAFSSSTRARTET